MNEKDFTLLDQYFNGELSPQEAARVLSRTESDTDFATAFHFRKDQEEFLQRDAKRRALVETLKTVGQDYFQEQSLDRPLLRPKSGPMRWLALAAGLALLLAAAWFLSRPTLPEYSAYAHHEPLSFSVRGQNEQAKISAEKAFNTGHYAAALSALDTVLKNEPDNVTAQLSRGICLLETGHPADARADWAMLAAGNSALQGEARWNIALSYLYEKNWPALKTALHDISPDMDHYEEAQKLLKSLR